MWGIVRVPFFPRRRTVSAEPIGPTPEVRAQDLSELYRTKIAVIRSLGPDGSSGLFGEENRRAAREFSAALMQVRSDGISPEDVRGVSMLAERTRP